MFEENLKSSMVSRTGPKGSSGRMVKRPIEVLGTIVQILLPSIKMKSPTDNGTVLEKEFHTFLVSNFGGYTVTSGSITGYWLRSSQQEECNEHREYQVAISSSADFKKLTEYLSGLAAQIKEQTVFCAIDSTAFLIRRRKGWPPANVGRAKSDSVV